MMLGDARAVVARVGARGQQRLGHAEVGGQVHVALQIGERVRGQLHAAYARVGLRLSDTQVLGDQVDVAAAQAVGLVDAQPGRA